MENSVVKYKKVLWSDETKMVLNGHQTKLYALHITTSTPSPLWSAVVAELCCGDAAAGPGRLVKVEGSMNAANYRKILQDNLIQSARKLWNRRRFIFQQDNESCSEIVKRQQGDCSGVAESKLRSQSNRECGWTWKTLFMQPKVHLLNAYLDGVNIYAAI